MLEAIDARSNYIDSKHHMHQCQGGEYDHKHTRRSGKSAVHR